MPPGAATTSVSTATEITSSKNVRNPHCSAVNANSLAAVITKTAPVGVRAAVRLTVSELLIPTRCRDNSKGMNQ